MYDYVLIYCSSKLVSLILNMIKNSESYLNQLVDVKAFQLIGYLLEKVNSNITNTVDVERFAGLKICGFSPMKIFWQEYFCGALASGVYYLTIAQYSQENSHGTLTNRENCKNLAQRVFPHLQYVNTFLECTVTDNAV